MNYRNCITPDGKFIYGIHKPSYSVVNLRRETNIESLGSLQDNTEITNIRNFPENDIEVKSAKWIYEIPNPLPFRGATFIDKAWADGTAGDYSRLFLRRRQDVSFHELLDSHRVPAEFFDSLPQPLRLALAVCSTDQEDLIRLAQQSCEFTVDSKGGVAGLRYTTTGGESHKPIIKDHDLFEAVANNPALPEEYKKAMVLRPGAQGDSEIVGEWRQDHSHVFEYLRKNSYIAGGHFAANMADDAVRYSIDSLTPEDMNGMRHLYYQRMYSSIAKLCNLSLPRPLAPGEEELEELRSKLLQYLDRGETSNVATLWGWNFGFDYSPTNYRLHASHQQIHQQYAMIPEKVGAYDGDTQHETDTLPAFCCGDLVTGAIEEYHRHTGSDLFTDYFTAIGNNRRMDDRSDSPSSLVVWEDNNVIVFVPKAQTSQWELQIMTKPDGKGRFAGNIVETDAPCRRSLNTALLLSQQVFARLGATMVTSIEFSKRLSERQRFDQPLLYSLLPKLPFSMGAFSEAQLRFINGHYPEDFAAVCRNQLEAPNREGKP